MSEPPSPSNGASANDYESLDLSFDDIAELEPERSLKQPPSKADVVKKHVQEDYILGTLIVRVVAARHLEPVETPGLGKMIFGQKNRATANPYASVRFGSSTQRTSEVFGTTDPTWPRGEAMYMDVMHPPIQYTTPVVESSEPETEAAPVTPTPTLTPHPGDPPKKLKDPPPTITAAPPPTTTTTVRAPTPTTPPRPDEPILTVAVFSASEIGKLHKFPSKGPLSGDSDDVFLGMTAINLTQLLTGKLRTFDEWLVLSGCDSTRAAVRVVCEYEASDPPPRAHDLVRFTGYCHVADLWPVKVHGVYEVQEASDADNILIATTSPEGWVSSFLVHRYMLVVVERHLAALDAYQEEMVSIAQRLSHSPMVSVVQEQLERLPDEGLVNIGARAIQGGANLLTRWLEGGLSTVVGDVAFATNWDGRLNPDTEESLATSLEEEDETPSLDAKTSTESDDSPELRERLDLEPLPNMPSCPITQEPMRDPVVAADGHTYERSAIVRWLKTSDKSPLTGSILPHKNLVPNYMLMSSLQEASRMNTVPAAPSRTVTVETVEDEDDDEVSTTEIKID